MTTGDGEPCRMQLRARSLDAGVQSITMALMAAAVSLPISGFNTPYTGAAPSG